MTNPMLSRREFSALAALLALQGLPKEALAANTPSLAAALKGKLLFGSAITPGQVTVSAPDFIKHHCSIVVAENAMKPQELCVRGGGEGDYDFKNADALADFAAAHGIKLRGHTLVWHEQTPSWMFTDRGKTVSREVLIGRMERYITDVVGHFKGRVHAWDVVNEAFVFGESKPADDNGMRMTPYREIIGPEYVEIAFRAAAKADPDALLFYNDYESQHPRKVEAVIKMVKALKAQGVKVDGIGHQAHCSMGHPDVQNLGWAIDQYAALGVTQHITEMDIALNERLTDSEVFEATPALLKRQAARYVDFFKLFLQKRDKVSAVLVWGLSDAQSWLRQWPRPRFEAPLLFDDEFQPKPAYKALLELARKTR